MQLTLALVLLISVAGAPDVSVLRWRSPDNSRPLTFHEWRSRVEPRPFQVKPLVSPNRLGNRVDFFVEESLAAALLPALETLAIDLERETVGVAVFSVSGTSAETLKSVLTREYGTGMTSAVLVGDLPIAWFQMIDDWDNDSVRDANEGYEEFPCDLFFMDLDGRWEDSLVRLDTLDSLIPGSDSIYDLHQDSITPEIFVSRLPASKIGDAPSLLADYFDKCHRYRNQELPVTDRALVYIDDDWVPWATEWDNNVGLLYPNRALVSDPETTRIAHYQPCIDTAAFQWIALMSHSWPGGHTMKYDSGTVWDWFYATSIPSLDPQASFYNLFACSNVRFVEDGYCGGCYVFQTSTGLGAIGSAKTGSMLEFADFYLPLADGANLGEAFRVWFETQLADGCANWERSWYYGMCLVADGTLRPRMPQAGVAHSNALHPASRAVRLLTNPARKLVRLQLSLARSAPCRVTLLDRTGRTVGTVAQRFYSAGTHELSANVSRLPAGVYFLSVLAGTADTRAAITLVR